MTLSSSHNCKKHIFYFLYILWLILSFVLPYYLIAVSSSPKWIFFSSAFLSYLIYFQSISIIGLIYILTNGKFAETKKHIKTIIIVTAILTVIAFTFIRWTTLTTSYGQYGHYVKTAPVESTFYFEFGGDTKFEKETIYREAVKFKYDTAFKQIWTFSSFIFFGTILILITIDRKNYNQSNRWNE